MIALIVTSALSRISEILAPSVDLFLSGGIPRHLASEGIGFALPVIGSSLHRGLKLSRLGRFSLCFEIVQNRDEDITFHLPELRQPFSKTHHRHGCLIGLVQIPIPWVMFHKTGVISGKSIKNPIRRCNVRIIVRSVDGLGSLLIPTGPALPIEIGAVIVRREFVRLVVEETLSDSVLLRSIFKLDATPDNTVHELFELGNLFRIRLHILLHGGGEPGSGATFIAQARNPYPTVLRDDVVGLPVISQHRGAAVKWVFGIVEPLLMREESSHIGNRLALRLHDEIMNRLGQTVLRRLRSRAIVPTAFPLLSIQ